MIKRNLAEYVQKVASFYPTVTLVGPRQSGKTTLARALFPNHLYCNLEAEDTLALAKADPRSFLHMGRENMVIDEVQRFPELLTYVQEMVDENKRKGQFVLTGSHQPMLNAAVSESLSGRTGICELLPLALNELRSEGLSLASRDEILWSGFMPRHYDDGIDPTILYRDYFHTYVQRDVRQLVNVKDLDTFIVFMRLLAGRVGQLLNRESLARDVGISVPTVVNWLNVLEASYVIYRLRPYYRNFGKRQTKAPKIYFTETGLATYLVGIRDREQLFSHPLVGSLFENMVVMEALKNRLNRGLDPDLWFYRNASGTIEMDLLIEDGGRLYPREIKSAATYSDRMSAHFDAVTALADNIEKPLIVYAGATHEGIAVNYADTRLWCR